jgi:hypothetical protein
MVRRGGSLRDQGGFSLKSFKSAKSVLKSKFVLSLEPSKSLKSALKSKCSESLCKSGPAESVASSVTLSGQSVLAAILESSAIVLKSYGTERKPLPPCACSTCEGMRKTLGSFEKNTCSVLFPSVQAVHFLIYRVHHLVLFCLAHKSVRSAVGFEPFRTEVDNTIEKLQFLSQVPFFVPGTLELHLRIQSLEMLLEFLHEMTMLFEASSDFPESQPVSLAVEPAPAWKSQVPKSCAPAAIMVEQFCSAIKEFSEPESLKSKTVAGDESAESQIPAAPPLTVGSAEFSLETAEISALQSAAPFESSTAQSVENAVQSAAICSEQAEKPSGGSSDCCFCFPAFTDIALLFIFLLPFFSLVPVLNFYEQVSVFFCSLVLRSEVQVNFDWPNRISVAKFSAAQIVTVNCDQQNWVFDTGWEQGGG